MYKVFTLLALLALIFGASAAEYPEYKDVMMLGDHNLEDAIKEFDSILVQFFSPQCELCKEISPEYSKAAAKLKKQNSKIKLAKVDATQEEQSKNKFNVIDYPTFKFFKDGYAYNYTGSMTADDIVQWVQAKSTATVLEVGHPQQLEMLATANKVVVVFLGRRKDKEFAEFERASRYFDDVAFLFSSSPAIKEKLKAPEGTKIVLLKKFDEGRNELHGTFDVESLVQFVRESTVPLVPAFDSLEAAQKVFGGTLPYIFLLYVPSPATEQIEEIFSEAARRLNGQINFMSARIDDGGFGFKLGAFTDIMDESKTPAVRLIDFTRPTAPVKYKLNSKITVENIVKFYEKFKAGKLFPYYRSQPTPKRNDGPVKIVVGNTFNEIVNDPTKDVFLEFYSPECGHCKNLAPIWEELGAAMASVEDLVIAKIDHTANDAGYFSVEGYPTIKLFPKNNKENPIDYEGGRTKSEMIAWLKKQLNIKNIEIPSDESETLDESENKPDGEL